MGLKSFIRKKILNRPDINKEWRAGALKTAAENKDAVTTIRLYDDEDFAFEDFGDSDHLMKRGAEKMTARVRNFI